MIKSSYEFEVIVHGSAAKEYYHKGSYYIEGKKGTRFSLRLCNNSSDRVLFVPTIDGISVLNAKEGSFKSRGYIVNSHSSTKVDGWRTSDSNINEFFFSAPEGAYSVKVNKGVNVGVIGCAVIREKDKKLDRAIEMLNEYQKGKENPKSEPFNPRPMSGPWLTTVTADNRSYSTSNVTPTAYYCANAGVGLSNASNNFQVSSFQESKQGIGTGFGSEKYAPVVKVDFDREDSPVEVFTMYYNTRQELENIGVEFIRPVYVSPSAFPNEDGYCPKP